MKPLFAIDVTEDKKNEVVNGSEFITKNASVQNTDALEDNQEELRQSIKKSQLPFWLQIVMYILGMFALLVILNVISNGFDIGFTQVFRNAPILIIAGFLCGIAWLVLYLYSKKKSKKVLQNENVDKQIEDIEKDFDKIYNELGVPSDAINIDILMFRYKIKNGEVKLHTGMQNTQYINLEVKAFTDGKYLHFADASDLYSFDLAELREIKTVNKRISAMNWTKEESPRKGEYKQYKIMVNTEYGYTVSYKPYYILEGEHNGEKYGIYFPCYEINALEKLTGLKAHSDAENE